MTIVPPPSNCAHSVHLLSSFPLRNCFPVRPLNNSCVTINEHICVFLHLREENYFPTDARDKLVHCRDLIKKVNDFVTSSPATICCNYFPCQHERSVGKMEHSNY